MIAPSHLRSLQAVELAVRTGSLVAAADVLAITPAAAGQRVKVLEDYLGVELLRRGRGGVEATAELRAALPHLEAAFAALEGAAAALELQRGRDIHIAAIPDFADLWLKPRLPRFQAYFPNLRFCINGEGDAPPRIGRPDCEIAFASPPEPGDARADLLFHDRVLPLCSPDIAARIEAVSPPDRLEGFPLVHVDFYKDDPAQLSWPHWVAHHGVARTNPERGMRYRRITPALDAVAANAGVALCGLALILNRWEAGAVTHAYPDVPARATAYAFVARFRADAGARRGIEQFRAWMREEAAATSAQLSHYGAASRTSRSTSDSSRRNALPAG